MTITQHRQRRPSLTPPRWLLDVRLLLAALIVVTAGCASLDGVGALLGNRVAFTPAQLQRHLDRHSPREYRPLGKLVVLSVLNPQLSIPRDGQRLHLDFDIGLDGLGLDKLGVDRSQPAGHAAITSALRYDPVTAALYLDNPRLESVEIPLLGGRMGTSERELINRWLTDYARDEPVYRLEPKLLEKLGERRVVRTVIENGRVVIELDR